MTHYLESILPKILSYSQKLDKLALLLNEPWVVTGDDSVKMKLIFKSDGEVIVSDNGNVQFGKWELLNRASSILIRYEKSAKLYNHAFFDEGILALKLDGSTDFFVLANQNKIQDLNVANYLNLRYGGSQDKIYLKLDVNKLKSYQYMTDKGDLVIYMDASRGNIPINGDIAVVNGQPAPDGKYKLDSMHYIHLKDGRIHRTTVF